MKTFFVNDFDLIKSISPQDNTVELDLPRPFTLWHDYKMRRWMLKCPEKPQNHPIYNIFWQECSVQQLMEKVE